MRVMENDKKLTAKVLQETYKERTKMNEDELKDLADEFNEVKGVDRDWIDPKDYTDLIDSDRGTYEFNFSDSGVITGPVDLTATSTPTVSVNAGSVTMSPYEDYDPDKEVKDRLDAIEERLKILVPDPKLLEKYKVLESLYEQYKTAEAFFKSPGPEDEDDENNKI